VSTRGGTLIRCTKGFRTESRFCAASPNISEEIGGSRRRRERTAGAAWMRFLTVVVLLLPLPMALVAAPLPAPHALASSEFQSGHFEAASKALENALRQHPDNVSDELLLARCYYELKDWTRAAFYAEAAKKLDPQNADVHLWLGRIYGREADEEHSLTLAVRTRKEFEKAVSLDPSDVEAHRDLMEFYLDAPWVLGGGKEKAKKQVNAIATLNPAAGALARGHFDEKTGDFQQAEGEFRHVVQLKPDRVGPYLEAADFFESHQNAAGMAEAVAAATKVNPSDPRLDYYEAVVDILQGKNLDQAERKLKTYLALAPERSNYPSRASALSWLGQLYERIGKPKLAAQQFHAALQLDPDLPLAQEGLDRLVNRGQPTGNGE
jgi:tetratricopeptide (TPR) repeat protein